ncbi:hypothetical protein Taro_046265, partial [Colocasia esculenta]|nr:hypothetical protein [Colocasia esculenta]
DTEDTKELLHTDSEREDVEERADVWWSSVLRKQFGDGAMEVAWAEFVCLFRAKYILEHVQDRMEQEFLTLT